jgi:hypothetical protein
MVCKNSTLFAHSIDENGVHHVPKRPLDEVIIVQDIGPATNPSHSTTGVFTP